MVVKLLLDAKREGKELAPNDIRELIAAYTRGEVPDYQMAAFAMAVCCNGMTDSETFALTDAMRLSGVTLDWSDLPAPTADKHSTGGVGDKLSFIIQPLASSCGVAVPSLAGRGLGLTGGTVDKLEAIPGIKTELSVSEFKSVVANAGVSIAAQTKEIAPADKKLYALRDVTGTVPSIPLIVASILSKKLAEGAQTLVFDVKCGKGAFMKTPEEASNLAHALVNNARAAGRKCAALVTRMDAPLGCEVGNANEVIESMRILRGEAGIGSGTQYKDAIYLSVEFAAMMVSLAKDIPLDTARMMCRENLANGKAYEKFALMVKAQGGDIDLFEKEYEEYRRSVYSKTLSPSHQNANEDGSCYVEDIDALAVAEAAFELGAGRKKAGDGIDFKAEVSLLCKPGDVLRVGDAAASIRGDQALCEKVFPLLAGAYKFSPTPVEVSDLIIERIMQPSPTMDQL